MKIVTAKEMGRIEKLAYAEGASEESFMESAGRRIAEAVQGYIARKQLKPKIALLCGSGNNAGDAYVAGRILLSDGFTVQAFSCVPESKCSPLCQHQWNRFNQVGGEVELIHESDQIAFGETKLLVDGLLGTGFHGEVAGLLRKVIEQANASGLPILAIDIPSGIDGTSGALGGVAIRATETHFLGLPKTGCFSQEAWEFVGKVFIHDFGLDSKYIEEATADYQLIDEQQIRSYLPSIKRTRHKYEAGYVVGLGGSAGMPGAPILSSFAALRAGAGIVRLLHPAGMEAELAGAPYEVIRQGYREGDATSVLTAMEKASALFIGPGLGTSPAALTLLKAVLPHVHKPCVIDAEALTLIAEHAIPLPSQTIMTPHHGEMKRLLKAPKEISFKELVAKSGAYADQNKITLILKGAPTYIFHPDTPPFICAQGDPGMATAGSGDVLTGIIAAFLAQTHTPLQAALLGVYFHSLAGERAAEKWTSYSMVASDITDALPQVFKEVLARAHVSTSQSQQLSMV